MRQKPAAKLTTLNGAAARFAALRPGGGVAFLPPPVAWLEIVILLVPVILLEWLVPAFPDITQFQPHPYWFPVLLLSLQYGTVSGLAAAAVAIVGTLLIGLPEPDIGENYFLYLVRVWLQPVLWVLAALILGQFRVRQIASKAALDSRVLEMASQNATLFGHAQALRARCDRLERRIVTRATSSGERVLDRLAQLSGADAVQRGAAFTAAAAAAFPGGTLSVYALEADGLRCIARGGAAGPSGVAGGVVPVAAPVWQALAGDGAALSVLDPGSEPLLAGLGIAAVPIVNRVSGAAIGMLVAEMLPAPAMNARLAGRLAVLASHLADTLAAEALGGVGDVTGAAAELPGLLPRLRRWRQVGRTSALGRGVELRAGDPNKSSGPGR